MQSADDVFASARRPPWVAMLVSAIGHGAVIAMVVPATGYSVGIEPVGAFVVRWAEDRAPTAARAEPVEASRPRSPALRTRRISNSVPSPLPSTEVAPASSATEPATPAPAAESASATSATSAASEANARGESVPPIVAPLFNADYLSNPAPTYPPGSLATGEQGKVFLSVQVSPTGEALDVRLRVSSGFDRLDLAALETVRRWKFVPARQGAEAIAAWVVVPISFSLRR